MLRKIAKGQTAIELTLLLVLVIAAFLAIQNYVKRGIQGRWKDAVDDLGDQYDPRTAITSVTETMTSSTNTQIIAIEEAGGFWTMRTDDSSSVETRVGNMDVGSY